MRSVPLSEHSLDWLRAAHEALPSVDGVTDDELATVSAAIPAWIEPCLVLARAVADPTGGVESDPNAGSPAWVDERFDCPQVVDVDFPTMAFDRAEWIGSSLYLGLAPRYEDPKVHTTFRIVGVEPRQWDIAGIDGAMVDAKANGVVVRIPLKRTLMSFTPSSY